MPFVIEVRFNGGLTNSQQLVFQSAANRWAEVIDFDGAGPFSDGDSAAHLVIDAEGADLGGVGGILGQAGPTVLLRNSGRPIRGQMQFDIADINRLELDGGLLNTVIHEMGHVLGIGSLWASNRLVHRSNTEDPVYVGIYAAAEYACLLGRNMPIPVPLENQGGPGTREGHWRETIFQTELMTGFLNNGHNPLSRLTVASLRDLGYQTNFNSVDSFLLPDTIRDSISTSKPCSCLASPPIFQSITADEAVGHLTEACYENRLVSCK